MKYSKLFGKTIKEISREETSVNAKLLTRAGFIRKEVAGVYNFLPLGLRALNKIAQIVREEMNKAGGQEVLLSSLQGKENWEKTGRWESFDALFRLASKFEKEYALGPTHEEVLVPLISEFISSYRDLPIYVYQIQNKFRDEARAKAGLLRGREFLMKDLYSFHADEKNMMEYYEKMKKVYINTFNRLGLSAIETRAAGGTFSKFSHEYQVICESGEDQIIYCPGGDYAENVEIIENPEKLENKQCDLGHGSLKRVKVAEVGNIFPLKNKFSEPFNLVYKDKDGKDQFVYMGCYGIGISRVMGVIVEVHHDENGIIWPRSVAPYQAHFLTVNNSRSTINKAEKIYNNLQKSGIDILYDDREVSPGEKFADADLIGIPARLVLSEKTGDKIEWKERNKEKKELLSIEEAEKRLKEEKEL
ncbi:MAG: hypothetical protein HYT08_04965 [Candidatus Levybacteria bacterium]|nr:hypothetical protein [Candidatus Levybacteria bacterium]